MIDNSYNKLILFNKKMKVMMIKINNKLIKNKMSNKQLILIIINLLLKIKIDHLIQLDKQKIL